LPLSSSFTPIPFEEDCDEVEEGRVDVILYEEKKHYIVPFK